MQCDTHLDDRPEVLAHDRLARSHAFARVRCAHRGALAAAACSARTHTAAFESQRPQIFESAPLTNARSRRKASPACVRFCMRWAFWRSDEPPARGDAGASACPVDHSTRDAWRSACPVDGETRETYIREHGGVSSAREGAPLSLEREVSSIPRYYEAPDDQRAASTHESGASGDESSRNWVYPSPSQFYSAVTRKNHDVRAEDMSTVVPIHNAVNEEAWRRILEWEKSWERAPADAGPELVNFVGRPRDVTWRAWMNGLLGYQLPFDRHDWVVVRPPSDGKEEPQRMRYIIDFYAGRSALSERSAESSSAMMQAGKAPVRFHLDVRPAPDTFEGIAMRLHRWWSA